VKLVEFQPVNPPSLHSAFIGGIDVFGVTRALPIPLPTTIAGAIGSYLNIYLTSSDPVDALVELYNAISAKLNCRDLACIRGPLVYFEVDDRRIGPYVSIEDYFTQLDSIRVYGSSVVCVEDTGEIVEWNPRVRVGVALERRGVKGDKRVIPGYFYKYVVSTYRLGSRIVNPVFTYITPLTIEHSVLLRLGGEGSVAVVKSRDVDYLDRVVERVTSPLGELEEGYYIALSPIPLLPRKSIVESWRDLETPLNPEYSEVLGIPMKCPVHREKQYNHQN